MYGPEARRLGRALLYVGLSQVVLFAARFVPKSLATYLFWPILVMFAVLAVLYLWVGYRLWRYAEGTTAARFMKWGFILGLLLPAAAFVIDNVILLFFSSHVSAFIDRTWAYKVVALVPVLLFAIGLSHIEWVPRWVPRFAYTWLALTAVSLTPSFGTLPKLAQDAASWAVNGLQVVAFIGLALTLLARSHLDAPLPVAGVSESGRAEQALQPGAPKVGIES